MVIKVVNEFNESLQGVGNLTIERLHRVSNGFGCQRAVQRLDGLCQFDHMPLFIEGLVSEGFYLADFVRAVIYEWPSSHLRVL